MYNLDYGDDWYRCIARVVHSNVLATNGYTYWFNNAQRCTGYVVGNNNTSLKLTSQPTLADIYKMCVAAHVLHYHGVGYWYDTDNNTHYVDMVVHVDNLDEALELARKNNEVAIWDIQNNVEVYV